MLYAQSSLFSLQYLQYELHIGKLCSVRVVFSRHCVFSKIAGPSVCEVYGFILDKRKTALPTCVQFDEWNFSNKQSLNSESKAQKFNQNDKLLMKKASFLSMHFDYKQSNFWSIYIVCSKLPLDHLIFKNLSWFTGEAHTLSEYSGTEEETRSI